jgi:hypothetical protein
LRETPHPVSHPALASRTERGQVRLNSSERGGIKRWQVSPQELLDRDQIEYRQCKLLEGGCRSNGVLFSGSS